MIESTLEVIGFPSAKDFVDWDIFEPQPELEPEYDSPGEKHGGPCVSVVVPAHNEEAVIARCLAAILDGARPAEVDLVVACNGCSDATADVARSFGDEVRVVEIPVASKPAALNAADRAARGFPRFYVDADIILPLDSIRRTAQVLKGGGIMAAAPHVDFDLSRSNLLVRAFYRVWTRNPYFDSGKIGSGVYAVSKYAHARLGAFSDITADDEYVRRMFRSHERATVADCSFIVFPPRTLRGVVRIKTRSRRGNLELHNVRPDLSLPEHHTFAPFLARLAGRPALWPAVPVYFAVARRKQLTTLGATGALTKAGESSDVESLKALRALKQRLESRQDGLRDEAKLLNSRLISLSFLEEERNEVRNLLEDTRSALDAVRVESHNALPGTAVVKARGSIPDSPASDKRRASAVVGAGSGVAGTLGVFVLFGLVFRRYRLSDELDVLESTATVVGVLPAVSHDPPFLNGHFTHAIHRMRSELELQARSRSGARVITVAAADVGSGASTVALALARSCAEARLRTLLIDADLVDAATTGTLGLSQLPGVRESVLDNESEGLIASSLNTNLAVMPAGVNTDIMDENLSSESLSRILRRGRTKYDVVILDVGPFADRIAACLGAAHADQVVLVTRPGTTASRLGRLVDELHRIAPGRVSLALNFASAGDPALTAASRESRGEPAQDGGEPSRIPRNPSDHS